jgi:hypothetical protein
MSENNNAGLHSINEFKDSLGKEEVNGSPDQEEQYYNKLVLSLNEICDTKEWGGKIGINDKYVPRDNDFTRKFLQSYKRRLRAGQDPEFAYKKVLEEAYEMSGLKEERVELDREEVLRKATEVIGGERMKYEEDIIRQLTEVCEYLGLNKVYDIHSKKMVYPQIKKYTDMYHDFVNKSGLPKNSYKLIRDMIKKDFNV